MILTPHSLIALRSKERVRHLLVEYKGPADERWLRGLPRNPQSPALLARKRKGLPKASTKKRRHSGKERMKSSKP